MAQPRKNTVIFLRILFFFSRRLLAGKLWGMGGNAREVLQSLMVNRITERRTSCTISSFVDALTIITSAPIITRRRGSSRPLLTANLS